MSILGLREPHDSFFRFRLRKSTVTSAANRRAARTSHRPPAIDTSLGLVHVMEGHLSMSVTGASQATAKISRATPPSERCPGSCLYRVIEFQAAQRPDAVCLTAPGRAPLTYIGLRNRVEQIIESLNAFGIGRNDRV